MKLTSARFDRLTNNEKLNVYLNHEVTRGTQHKNGFPGPSVTAQAALHNDFQQAFYDFSSKLPLN